MSSVLIVDEDGMQGVASVLEKSGFRIVLAGGLGEAWRRLYLDRPQLVILAEQLCPAQEWGEVLPFFRACNSHIIVVGFDQQNASSLLEAGADAFMSRPLNFDELLARIRSLLRREHARAGKPSPTHDALTRAHNRITPTEFRLLSCLVLNEGKLIENNELIKRVWGRKQVSIQCLRFYIRRLRQKLAGSSFGSGEILNQRGIGYRYADLLGRQPEKGFQ